MCTYGSLENLIDLLKQINKKPDDPFNSSNVSNQLAQDPTSCIGLGEELAKIYMAQMVNVLEYLQLNYVVHRDLKPMNLMLDSNCNIKLIDFGDAKKIEIEL